MKGIQEFLKDLETNEELAKEFEGVEKEEDVVKLAKEKGYEFTKEDYMDAQMNLVSGGIGIGDVIKRGGELFQSAVQDNEWEDLGEGMYRNRSNGEFWDSVHGSLRKKNGYWITNYRG